MINNVGNFVISIDTEKLIARLKAVEPGKMVTTKELSDTIGRDITNGAYAQFRAARRNLEATERIHFVSVPGQGYRRLPTQEVARSGLTHIRRTRSAARRGQQRMAISDEEWKTLSNEDRISHNASVAVLGAIEHSASSKALRLTAEKITNGGALPSLAETLDCFKH